MEISSSFDIVESASFDDGSVLELVRLGRFTSRVSSPTWSIVVEETVVDKFQWKRCCGVIVVEKHMGEMVFCLLTRWLYIRMLSPFVLL